MAANPLVPRRSAFTSVRERFDSWLSAVTGVGTDRDKATSYRFRRAVLSLDVLEALYDEDPLAHRMCMAGPRAMWRGGVGIKTGDPDEENAIAGYVKRLDLPAKFVEAQGWEAAFGGAALVVGVDDGRDMAEPVDLANIRSIRYVLPVDRRDIEPVQIVFDPLSPYVGQAEVYRVVPSPDLVQVSAPRGVHRSRLILFSGAPVSRRKRFVERGWGGSRLGRAYEAVRRFSSIWGSTEALVQDASQGVFKIPGLVDMITSGDKQSIQDRFEVVDMGRSVARSLILDSEEDFTRIPTTFTELPNLLDRAAQLVSAASEIPVSILMGRSPAGLNATGDAETRAWYDAVAEERTQSVEPRLRQVLDLILLAADGPTGGVIPPDLEVSWPSLWQTSPDEEADLDLKKAQAAGAWIASGVLTPAEATLIHFADNPAVDTGARAAEAATYAKAAADPAAPPLPPIEAPPAPAGTP